MVQNKLCSGGSCTPYQRCYVVFRYFCSVSSPYCITCLQLCRECNFGKFCSFIICIDSIYFNDIKKNYGFYFDMLMNRLCSQATILYQTLVLIIVCRVGSFLPVGCPRTNTQSCSKLRLPPRTPEASCLVVATTKFHYSRSQRNHATFQHEQRSAGKRRQPRTLIVAKAATLY